VNSVGFNQAPLGSRAAFGSGAPLELRPSPGAPETLATRVLSVAHTAVKRSIGRLRYHPLRAEPGIECHLVTPSRWTEFGRDFVADPPGDPGIQLHIEPIRFSSVPGANWYLHYYPRLRKLVRDIAPDVIHLWEEPWSVVAWQALRLRDRHAPKASFVLEVDQNILKRLPPPFEQMRRHVLRHTDLILVRSPEAEHVARASGFTGPSVEIGYGVDRSGFAPHDKASARAGFDLSGFTIGYVGRIVEEKGLDDAIDALALTAQPVTLAIMGEGPYLPQIKARALALNVADRVRYFDWRKPHEVARFMSALDALVLLTRTTSAVREQFGRVIIEAQSCGTPVIGSQCGAIPSVVGAGGWIIPERNPAALAALLDRIGQDAGLIRRAGAIGVEQVNARFTYESVARTLARAWRLSCARI
jgi:glycosyltransferase involved in cell wall biosynthesis